MRDKTTILALLLSLILVPLEVSIAPAGIAVDAVWKAEFRKGKDILQALDDIDKVYDQTKDGDFQRRIGSRPQKAIALLRSALAGARSAKATEATIADIQFVLGRALMWRKDYKEAKELIGAARKVREKLEPDSPSVADCLVQFAAFAQKDNDHDRAEELMRKAYDLYVNGKLPLDDPRFTAVVGALGVYSKETSEKVKFYGQLFLIDEKRYGKSSPRLVTALIHYAAALGDNCEHEKAARVYGIAADITDSNPGKVLANNSRQYMREQSRIAVGKSPDSHKVAKPGGQDVSSVRVSEPERASSSTMEECSIIIDRGSRLLAKEKYTEAVKTFEKALALVDPNSLEAAGPYCMRGIALMLMGEFELAGEDFDKCHKVTKIPDAYLSQVRNLKGVSTLLRMCFNGRVICALFTGDYEKAYEFNKRALELLDTREKQARIHLLNSQLCFIQNHRQKSIQELELAESKNPEMKERCDQIKTLWEKSDARDPEEREQVRAFMKDLLKKYCNSRSTHLLTTCKQTFKKTLDETLDRTVESQMQSLRIAAEQFAADHQGAYPKAINESFKSYLRKRESQNYTKWPAENPFNGKSSWPIAGTVADLKSARMEKPDALSPGTIEYTPLNGGKSYAIRGGGHDGFALSNESGDGTLVLSTDSKY